MWDIVRGSGDDLMQSDGGDGGFWPLANVTLSIDLRLMTDEQRDMVSRGVDLIRGAGVRFDRGVGFGFYDIELDWSLHGARVMVRPFTCQNVTSCSVSGFSPAYWSLIRTWRGDMAHRVYCSPHCREQGDTEGLEPVTLRDCFHVQLKAQSEPCCDAPITYEGPSATVVLHDQAPAITAVPEAQG